MESSAPRNRNVHRGWQCDNCGELIVNVEDGQLEWLSIGNEPESMRIHGLRLVHACTSDPHSDAPPCCHYDGRGEFRKNGSLAERLSLTALSGPDGLVLMLSMLAQEEFPAAELIEITKRLYVPGYEQARDLFSRAIRAKVLTPSIGRGYYLQSEIWDVLQWARAGDRKKQVRPVPGDSDRLQKRMWKQRTSH